MSRFSSFSPVTLRIARPGVPLVLLLLVACGGGSSGPTGTTGGGAALSGTVRVNGSAALLSGAVVTVGSHTATTDANGHFELTGLATGAATARAARPGYSGSDAALTLTSGSNSHDFSLEPQEIYLLGSYAVFVPAGVGPMRGAIIMVGGPNTIGFATGGAISPGASEAGLQDFATGLRGVARSMHLALVGTSDIALPNSVASDNQILAALTSVAQPSDHAELAAAPLIMFGLSAGGPEAAGLASRQPLRTIGLIERVPSSVSALTDAAALAVPTFVMEAGLDQAFNAVVQPVFTANRALGGLWALAVEPGVEHPIATTLGNGVADNWIVNVLGRRLPAHSGDPLVALTETTGWLGNQGTHVIAAWANYVGSPTAASWLLNQDVAQSWKSLATSGGGGGGGLHSLRSGVAPDR